MSMQDEPLAQALDNLRRMSASQQEALDVVEHDNAQPQLQEAIRYGEQSRDYIEEIMDSADEDSVILHAEQALDNVEEALDRANQALFASELSMREHIEQMGPQIQQALAQLDLVAEIEIG